MRITPRVVVKKLISRWSISSSARCCDRHALLMISWFTTMSQKIVSDNGSDWCSDTPRRRRLHTVNNTVAKGFNQMAPHAQTITVALDMSKDFDTIHIHTLIRKLLQTNIPGTISRFIANYIKGRKAYTTYRNHTSSQRLFKTAFHKLSSVHQHYSTYTLQTHHHQEH